MVGRSSAYLDCFVGVVNPRLFTRLGTERKCRVVADVSRRIVLPRANNLGQLTRKTPLISKRRASTLSRWVRFLLEDDFTLSCNGWGISSRKLSKIVSRKWIHHRFEDCAICWNTCTIFFHRWMLNDKDLRNPDVSSSDLNVEGSIKESRSEFQSEKVSIFKLADSDTMKLF